MKSHSKSLKTTSHGKLLFLKSFLILLTVSILSGTVEAASTPTGMSGEWGGYIME